MVADHDEARGYQRVGLTGTAWLVKSNVYPDKLAALGIACMRPTDTARDAMGRIIMDELVPGSIQATSVAYVQTAIDNFKQ